MFNYFKNYNLLYAQLICIKNTCELKYLYILLNIISLILQLYRQRLNLYYSSYNVWHSIP